MSYTAIGKNKVYASIEDLPENQTLANGDRLLVQTEEGTVLVDYENIKIDTAHTDFGDKIEALIQFTSEAESFIEQILIANENLKKNVEQLTSELQKLKDKVDNLHK